MWTGRELVVVGGYAADGRWASDGISYDPAARAWRRLPPAPAPLRQDGTLVWTGSELIAFGGGPARSPVTARGEAYDPRADRWRRIAEAPLGMNAAEAVWDGRRMVAVGALLDARRAPASREALAEAYDPASDAWRRLPHTGLSPQAVSAALVAGRLVAWDYAGRAERYVSAVGRWQALSPVPVRPGECYPESALAAAQLFAWYCGQAALLEARSGRWSALSGGPLSEKLNVDGAAVPRYESASLAEGGRVVVLVATEAVVRHGEVCVGCRGARTRLWVYRPPG